MKARTYYPNQLLLFERQHRWQDLPQDTREHLVQLLARLFVESLNSSPQPNTKEQPHVSR